MRRKTALKDGLKEETGPLYRVVSPDGRPVYGGKGVGEKEAQRLAEGLIEPAEVVAVEEGEAE